MESKSWIAQFFSTVADQIGEQVWFQQLKAKWDELDAQSRLYLKVLGGVLAVLGVLLTVIMSIYSVYAIRSEYQTKSDLLTMLQSANDELRRLKESTASAGSATSAGGPWPPYLEGVAINSGLDKTALTISSEKAGASTETIKEALMDLSLKHVNIRQIVRYAFSLETGTRPVKLRNLTVDTKSDPTGYMDATLAVSGFSLITK